MCNCKKGCINKHCTCLRIGNQCQEYCNCLDCKNFPTIKAVPSQVAKPIVPSVTKKAVPSQQIIKPIVPAVTKKAVPSQQITKPIVPSQQIIKPIVPSQQITKPIAPSQQITKPTVPSQQIIKPIVPSQQIIKPIVPSQQITKPIVPSQQITKPIVPSQQITKPIVPSQQIIKPIVPSQQIIKPIAPSQQIIKPIVPSQQIIKPIVPSQQITKPIVPSQQIAKPEILKPTIAITKRTSEGCFYDHVAIQNITQCETFILLDDQQEENIVYSKLAEIARGYPYYLEFGKVFDTYKVTPQISKIESYEHGLLIITGRSTNELKSERKAEKLMVPVHDDLVRKNLEDKAINNALLRGQPILSICAGQWRLITCIINMDKSKKKKTEKELLVETKGHNHRRMMSLSKSKRKVIYNVIKHTLDVEKNSMFQSLLEKKEGEPAPYPVNSVHGYSPKSEVFESIPTLEIGARSSNLYGSSGSEVGVPEAFTYNGIVVGVLWHPEASEQKNNDYFLFQSMVKMGLQYKKKRDMLKEFLSVSHYFKDAKQN
ncbi:hypothetical protein ACTFIW_005547 [Dictyostelium discoideum]